MSLHILAFLGGMLTIFSPCVLPVVPFLFTRTHLSFLRSGMPTLLGMALSFSLFGLLSAAGGQWVIQANAYGRAFAMVIFAILGLSLLFPKLSDCLMQPLVRLGGRIQAKAAKREGVLSSLVIGASLGLLWAPCAGPILGLVLAGAAVQGLSQSSFTLLFAFAIGAATSLAIALLASRSFVQSLKRNLGIEETLKKVLGALVLLSVLAIGLGLDTKVLAKLDYLNTNRIEEKILANFSLGKASSTVLSDEGEMPPLSGAEAWLNSKELSREDLRGKVVLVDFWTYSCINCIRTLPYLKAWWEKYKDKGLVVVGVHSPEFAFEKQRGNVEAALRSFGITYPVAIDNDLRVWEAFQNLYWPAHYFVDSKGRIRYHHFGEGGYEESEAVIRQLLKEANPQIDLDSGMISADVKGQGLEEKPGQIKMIKNPETYLGYDRMENFVSPTPLNKEKVATYTFPLELALRDWSLSGEWLVEAERIRSTKAGGRIALVFEARDLHLVLGGAKGLRFRVTIDGRAPNEDHGVDLDAEGNGVIGEERLYQLIRLKSGPEKHRFEIEFLDSGAEAFAFTFG